MDGIELVVTRGEEGGTVVTGGVEGEVVTRWAVVMGVTTGGDASDAWWPNLFFSWIRYCELCIAIDKPIMSPGPS